MSEQSSTQSSINHRRSRKTSIAKQQIVKQILAAQRPTIHNRKAWKVYWEEQKQPWRIEPEIDEERQKYLAERRSIKPDIEQGIYPFKNVKLSRADVEWLLATHENGRGPVIWSDETQQERPGLDLRGANLRQVNLQNLPLARLRGGLSLDEWTSATAQQRNMATISLEQANLRWVHLEGAYIRGAHLEGANLLRAHLEKARLEGAHLEGAILKEAYLEKASLTGVILSSEQHIGPYLADVHWGDVNLTGVKWSQMVMIGEEHKAGQKLYNGKMKTKATSLEEYETAVRANRQIATALLAQGLNEEADHFAYHAQKLQRVVLRQQRKLGRYLFFGFLDILAGYGYRPGRSVFWYLAIVCGFALAYHLLGQLSLFPPDAFVYSLTSFHGRGFFPGLEHRTSLHDPLIVLAALEAVVGLFIEISFIATFTQRFFGR